MASINGYTLTATELWDLKQALAVASAPSAPTPPAPPIVTPVPTPPVSAGAGLVTDLPWGQTIYSGQAFPGNGYWAGRFVVPTSWPITGAVSYLTVAEYQGPPTAREVTLSRFAGDFRPIDPTGANGPVSASSGNTASIYFTIEAPRMFTPNLKRGETWFFNVRNYSSILKRCTCTVSSCPAVMACHPY